MATDMIFGTRMRLLMLLLVLGLLSACQSIKAWEREYLADEMMRFDPDPLETSWHLHVDEVLESGRGGYSSTGGGCGCK